MENPDYEHPPARKPLSMVWNTLTVLVLLTTCCIMGIVLMIFFNPYVVFNPYPPPTIMPEIVLPTSTPTPMFPPTWTPTPSPQPTATSTRRPTATLPPSVTPFSLLAPSPGTTLSTPERPASGYSFEVQNMHVVSSTIINGNGCNWMGVAGQVVDLRGSPIKQLIVILGGSLGGKPVHSTGHLTSLTGIAPQYGLAGYEFVLASKPIPSKNTLWVQIVDQAGTPLSDKAMIDTFDNCNQNLVLVNFKQVR